MRIAYLTNQYPKISHTFIRREIEALERLGLEVLRYSVRACPDPLVDPADVAELERTRVVLDSGGARLMGAAAQVAARHPAGFARALSLAGSISQRSERGPLIHSIYLMEACQLLLWLREAEVDHVHVHFGTNPATVAMLCHALGGPTYSFTAHGPEEFEKPHWIRLREKIEHASFVAGVSRFGRSQLLRHSPREHWDKIQVVRCGVDEAFFEPPLTEPPAEPRLLYVGRLDAQKAPTLLIEAAARLRDAGETFELTMVGDGTLRPEIERMIDEFHLGESVTLLGWASGSVVREQILRSRALILPSFAEGLPVVIMEALAMGRPVLSTYVAGIPELVVPGETGWLVPPGSVSCLATAVHEILAASPSDLSRLGQNGRRRVRRQHDVEVGAARLARLFASAVRTESACNFESATLTPTESFAPPPLP